MIDPLIEGPVLRLTPEVARWVAIAGQVLQQEAVRHGLHPTAEALAAFEAVAKLARAYDATSRAAASASASDPCPESGNRSTVTRMTTTTTAEAAAVLQVSDRRVRQLLAAGSLNGCRAPGGTWSVERPSLDVFAARRRSEPADDAEAGGPRAGASSSPARGLTGVTSTQGDPDHG